MVEKTLTKLISCPIMTKNKKTVKKVKKCQKCIVMKKKWK